MEGFTKYRFMGEWLGDRYNVFALPDPEAVVGQIPSIPIDTLAEHYAAAIRRHQPSGPYFLLGECIGGMDVFATACALEKDSRDPVKLFLLDCHGPNFSKQPPPRRKKANFSLSVFWHRVNKSLKRIAGRDVNLDASPVPGTRAFNWSEKMAICHRLFDPVWYLEQNPDVEINRVNPFIHYVYAGWMERRRPSRHFHADICKEIFPGFDPEKENPVIFFLRASQEDESLMKVASRLCTLEEDLPEIIKKYPVFDAAWYLEKQPDVIGSGIDPLQHYLSQGFYEKRQPSPSFYPLLYKHICPYYDAYRQNPILHFALIGVDDPEVERDVRNMRVLATQRSRILDSGWFDPEWYLKTHPSVHHYGHDPLTHFMTIGWRLGRKPFSSFDEGELASTFPSFAHGRVNPILLFPDLEVGESSEGVKGSPPVAASIPQRGDKEAASHVYDSPASVEAPDEALQEADIVKARRDLRRKAFSPGVYNGDAYLISSTLLHASDAFLGWDAHLNGRIRTLQASGDHESYLWDDLKANTELIGRLLDDHT